MSDIKFNEDASSIIKTIQDSVKTEKIDVKPGDYATRQVHRVPKQPLAAVLAVASLTGLVDYLNNNLDLKARPTTFIHVESPDTVHVREQLVDNEDRRFVSLTASADLPSIPFDQYLSQEQMMITLQAKFVDNEDRKNLLSSLGSIIADEELQQEDDGVGQLVTVQKGINRSEQAVKNPVQLRPFRTFAEVEQPESPFVVRIKKEHDKIYVALFEADGGAWRNAARKSIKDYLEYAVDDATVAVIA